MATITNSPTVQVEIKLTLNEQEARALHALTGYGTDAFLKAFYDHLGQHYLEPYESGIRSLFKTVTGLEHIFTRADKARSAFREPTLETVVSDLTKRATTA